MEWTPLHGVFWTPGQAAPSTLAVSTASSAAGSGITRASCMAGELRKLSVALVRGNEVVYHEVVYVNAAASNMYRRVGSGYTPHGRPRVI